MKVLLVTVVTLTAAIVLCSAADPECKLRMQKGLPIHWPNPSDCGRFYRCTPKNVKREVICPPEREYNQKSGKCALRGKGTCNLSPIAPAVDDTEVCNGQPNGIFLPKEDYCREFYLCNLNTATTQYCNIGSIFDQTTGACVPDTTNSCWQNICNGVADNTWLPDATSCLSFYICNANDATLQTCGSGSYFDVNICKPDIGDSNCWENFCLNKVDGVKISNDEDCHSYYLCNSQATVQETCQNGYYFDKNALDCLVGDCPKCTCPGGYEEGAMLPHPTDCNRFYICDNSKLLEQYCPDGTYFDSDIKACETGTCPISTTPPKRKKRSLLDMSISDFQTDIEDNDDNNVTVEDEVTKNETIAIVPAVDTVELLDEVTILDEKIEPIDVVTNANETIETPKLEEIAIELMCLDRYFEGDIISDPNNCQQFKVCINAQLVVQSCATGTYFDDTLLICKMDENDTCSKKLAATIAPSKNLNAAEDTPLCTCPGNIQPGEFQPHPTNCSLYYICNGISGELEIQDCSFGNFYNESSKACEPDTTNICWPKVECTCPGNIKPGAAVPHPDVCSLFYICDGTTGVLQLQNCGVGNRFDNDTKVCVPDTCGICNVPPGICLNQTDNTLLANPTQCYSFYLCINQEANLEVCNATQWFDPSIGYCVLDVDAKCRNPCENIDGIDFLPYPTDCTKFYFCNDGATTVQSCDPGSSFDAGNGLCLPGLSNCGSAVCTNEEDGKTFPVQDDNTKFYYCLNGVGIETSCDPGTIYNIQMGICLAQPSDNCNQTLCENAEEGLIAPTLDTQNASFCVCRYGAAYLEPCNAGYTFDLNKLICFSDADCDPAICPNSPDMTVFPNKNNDTSFCLCVTNEAVIVNCPKNGTFNPSVMACQLPVPQDPNCNQTICPTAPSYEAFPSLTADNTTFCICIDGGATLLDCPPGSGFDSDYGVCLSNVPPFDIAQCQSEKIFYPVPNNIYAFYYCSDENTVQLINCPPNTVYMDHYMACLEDPCNQTVCEDPAMANTAFPAIDNPYIFCYCETTDVTSTKAIWQACDAGTMFNPKYGVCLSESINPDCDVTRCLNYTVGMTFPAINDPNGFCYCTSSDTAVKYSCNPGMTYDDVKNVCVNALLCNGKYTQYEVVSNSEVCNKYYLCFNGDLLDLTCANGLYFDSEALQCLPNNNNQCQILGDDCTCPGGYKAGDFLPHPSDCSLYYICSGGKLVESSCGTNNYFDKVTNSCQKDTTNCCATSATRTCVGNYREGEFVPHPTNVQSYYICSNARLMPASCGTGNMFDSKSKSCTKLPKILTSYKWKRSAFEMEDVRTLFEIKPIIKKLTDSFGNLFA